VAGFAVLTAAPASAQSESGASFVAGLAYADGSPGPALADALRAAGMDGVRSGTCNGVVCIEPVEHPFYYDEGLNLSFLLGVRYRMEWPISFEILLSNGARGHAEGYNSATFDHLVVSYTSFVLSTTVGAHLGPLRFEAGPVFNSTGWKSTLNSTEVVDDRTLSVGTAIGISAGVDFKEVVLTLHAGYRRYPSPEFDTPIRTPLTADYSAFYVGLTASKLIR
jgi:hypothetical protein